MSWKGKETQWFCYKCKNNNPSGFHECVFCVDQGNKGKKGGGKEKGKDKGKSQSSNGKGDYQYQVENYVEESPEKAKLKRLKAALKNLQGVEGMDDTLESLKADIKAQQALVNSEQGIDRAGQTAMLLTELNGKKLKGEQYRIARDFHHAEATKNAKNHQTTDEEIGDLYQELAALGWDPPESESEDEQEDPERMDYWEKPKGHTQAGFKETTSQQRARHARSRGPHVESISDEEQPTEERLTERRLAAESAAADRTVKQERQKAYGRQKPGKDALAPPVGEDMEL
jgi:hypothetical protein